MVPMVAGGKSLGNQRFPLLSDDIAIHGTDTGQVLPHHPLIGLLVPVMQGLGHRCPQSIRPATLEARRVCVDSCGDLSQVLHFMRICLEVVQFFVRFACRQNQLLDLGQLSLEHGAA